MDAKSEGERREREIRSGVNREEKRRTKRKRQQVKEEEKEGKGEKKNGTQK